ncbi:hypothetical protein [Pontibacter korlensis]|uniref:hypothetical protein n=1 Tax=Pontibacter korlensis TaxID=400092 RepID=UPI00130D7DDD|nr:hypothetical protein [Pontibacter korlensis]
MYNRLVASLRVCAGHMEAGVKGSRITKEKIRLHGQLRNSVMLFDFDLHNLMTDYRK